MKILFYYYKGGGGGFANITLLLRTMARLHPEDEIEILTSPFSAFDALNDIHNVRVRKFSFTGLKEIDRLLLGIFWLPKIANETKADILWSMNLGPYVKTGLPSVLSINNPYQVCPWSVSRYHPGSPWHVAMLRWFFRRSLNRTDAVIVQTNLMRDYVRSISGAPGEICVAPKSVERMKDVKPEPLPPNLQDAIARGLGRETFTFLYVATHMPHKNHGVLVKAFSELAKKNIRVRVILTIDPEDILALWGNEAAALINMGYIVPVGWIAKTHLRALYAASDACLMPSVLESLSSAHIEAMRWERPQITADVVYSHEVCGPAALYVREDDSEGWAAQIERVMRDETLRKNLIQAGRERLKQFPATWDDASEIVHRFLERINGENIGKRR